MNCNVIPPNKVVRRTSIKRVDPIHDYYENPSTFSSHYTVAEYQQQTQYFDNVLKNNPFTVHYLIGEQQTGKTTYMLNQFVRSLKAVFVSFQHNRLRELAEDPIVSGCDVVIIRRMEEICATYPTNDEMKEAIEIGFSRPRVHSKYCKDIKCPYYIQIDNMKSIDKFDHIICTIDTLLTHSEIMNGRDIFIDENEALFDEPEFPDTDIPQDDLDYIFDDRKPQSFTGDNRGCYLTNPVNHYVLKYSFTKRKEKKYVKELDELLRLYPVTKNIQRVKEINTVLQYLSGYIVTEHNGLKLRPPTRMFKLLLYRSLRPAGQLYIAAARLKDSIKYIQLRHAQYCGITSISLMDLTSRSISSSNLIGSYAPDFIDSVLPPLPINVFVFHDRNISYSMRSFYKKYGLLESFVKNYDELKHDMNFAINQASSKGYSIQHPLIFMPLMLFNKIMKFKTGDILHTPEYQHLVGVNKSYSNKVRRIMIDISHSVFSKSWLSYFNSADDHGLNPPSYIDAIILFGDWQDLKLLKRYPSWPNDVTADRGGFVRLNADQDDVGYTNERFTNLKDILLRSRAKRPVIVIGNAYETLNNKRYAGIHQSLHSTRNIHFIDMGLEWRRHNIEKTNPVLSFSRSRQYVTRPLATLKLFQNISLTKRKVRVRKLITSACNQGYLKEIKPGAPNHLQLAKELAASDPDLFPFKEKAFQTPIYEFQ